MQNPIQKSKESSIVLQEPGILPEKLRTLTSSNYCSLGYFLLKFCTRFSLTTVYKKLFKIFFYFVYILSYLQKVKKTWFLNAHRNQVFHTFINNSRSKQNKKNPKHPFVDTASQEMCAKSPQKILNSNWSSPKCSIFQRNNLVSPKEQSFD